MSLLADDMILYIENSQNKISSLVAQLVKNLLQCRKPGFDPWVRKIPWRRKRQPNPVFLLGESHGQRGLAATVHGVVRAGPDLATKPPPHK